ncbi:LDLR chaperone boca isoform X2 [Daktulosphaira vitifoliae]|uniref:LDLR chaperone boca isoform X2 n=1 Tax=Daktulosphaira vitifoliae TaxID=58002 RepID=UPI0021AA3727|nr:LDLR chaperone boca isoform X2 [Daktulosphaira vitifoliae]
MQQVIIFFAFLFMIVITISAKRTTKNLKPDWAKKDIRDYTEADLERLLDQWEEDEEPLEPDELPEHLRPSPKIDPTLIGDDPDTILKLSKKGKTLMTFVKVHPKYNKEESDKITRLWQSSLWNNHIQAERFMVDENRAIFMYKDGSQAWDAKDFLVQQEDCVDVTIENQIFQGPANGFVMKGNVDKVEL